MTLLQKRDLYVVAAVLLVQLVGEVIFMSTGGYMSVGATGDFNLEYDEQAVMKVYNWENDMPELIKVYTDDPYAYLVCSADMLTPDRELIRYDCHQVEDSWTAEKYADVQSELNESGIGIWESNESSEIGITENAQGDRDG